MSTAPSPNGRVRHQNMYAHHMWRQQRFFAGFLVVAGVVMTGVAFYQNKLFDQWNLVWTLYVPSGLLLLGLLFYYRWRSHVRALDTGLRISTFMSHVDIPYESIRLLRVMPLRNHFVEKRSRLIAPIMKQQVDKPALFIRLRGEAESWAPIQKKLGARLMHEDTIAIPVPDADALSWEINGHLPERIGQNLGGGKRRKRRR